MTAIQRYRAAFLTLLEASAAEDDLVERAGRLVADSLAAGGVLHVFGSGHSMLAAIDATFRAGGLAPVNLVFDPALAPWEPSRVSRVERLSGYGRAIADLQDLRSGEVIVVVSHSGINPVPVEVAQAARERGLSVVAVTSLAHSGSTASRHPEGLRLLDVADVVLDTHVPAGDVTLTIEGAAARGVATGPTSTCLAVLLVHSVVIAAMAQLVGAGADVPVLRSMNRPGSDATNDEVMAPFTARLSREP